MTRIPQFFLKKSKYFFIFGQLELGGKSDEKTSIFNEITIGFAVFPFVKSYVFLLFSSHFALTSSPPKQNKYFDVFQILWGILVSESEHGPYEV